MDRKIILHVLLAAITILTGCQTKPQAKKVYDAPLPPGALALRKITNPADIPDFTEGCYNLANLSVTIDRSLSYMNKPSSKTFYPYGDISHEKVVASLKAFKDLIASGKRGPQLNEAIRAQFDVYESVGCDNKGTVLFTGYYTPIFDGSWTQTEKFKYPLYKQPADLVKNEKGEILGRKNPDGSMTKYPPRAELEESGQLKGNELIWLGNPFEVYVAQVQGSAKIRLSDGQLVTVGYAATNGYDYQSISKKMVEDGILKPEQLNLQAMIAYFKDHAEQIIPYTKLNPRFVFFQKSEGAPRGSLNEPVTTMRTIATDKSVYPRASLAFLTTILPHQVGGQVYQDSYKGFALDQDTGGAIRAAGRCDVYMGDGDEAGKLAGQTYQEGRLYYLFLK